MKETRAINEEQNLIASAWRDQAIWSEVANQLKGELSIWRKRAAVASVLGAFLETLAATLTLLGERWGWFRALIALSGAVVLAIVPFVVRTKLSKEKTGAWVRARSASEALKEHIFRYLVGVPPFGAESTPTELSDQCEGIKARVEELNLYAAPVDPPPKVRPLSLSIDEYVEKRVNEQVENYYRPKGREKALTAKKLQNLEFGLGLMAVAMGAVAGAAAATGFKELSILGPWVAVITTATAAVTSHLAASRYDREAITYFGTADRLTGLRDRWLATPDRMDPARVAKFVDDCEHAISSENESWLTNWTEKQNKKDKP